MPNAMIAQNAQARIDRRGRSPIERKNAARIEKAVSILVYPNVCERFNIRQTQICGAYVFATHRKGDI